MRSLTALEPTPPQDDLSSAQALVVDCNPTSRAILVNQLREFGVPTVVQCARVIDARRQLEFRQFDIVLCEFDFGQGFATGQDLLDDLRRNQLLPFSTVFIMVTAEATYARVAEAAESALDGYLLKPHTASSLAERLFQARQRKLALQDIFSAIESEDFANAAGLCQTRFESRSSYWLYAARIGAELMLRIEKYPEAQTLYEAVVAAKTLPWAKLGVARAQLDGGEPARALSTLENLVSTDPTYADAYDVLGRAQFELGRLDRAIDAYRMACQLTPYSLTRQQSLGMLTYYGSDPVEAEKILSPVARQGLDSKLFDGQTLVLLAFARQARGDRKSLLQCRDDFRRLLERDPGQTRYQRLAAIVDALVLIQDRQFASAVAAIRALAAMVKEPDFDFESATNLLTLLAQLATQAIQLEEVDSLVNTLGMRFCTSRALSELLAGAAVGHPPYAEQVRTAHAQVLKHAEKAMALSMAGNPTAAVKDLLVFGNETLNAKLIETAYLVLLRYTGKIEAPEDLSEAVHAMRARYRSGRCRSSRPGTSAKRSAGGLSLRV